MGPIPMKEAKIREPVQSAIILYDQGKKRETIVLQTKLVSTRSAKGMFFMPLPNKPDISTAKQEVFDRVVAFAEGLMGTATHFQAMSHYYTGAGPRCGQFSPLRVPRPHSDLGKSAMRLSAKSAWPQTLGWLMLFSMRVMYGMPCRQSRP